MPIFGGPCKQLVNYDGNSLDLSGLSISAAFGAHPLKFGLGELKVKREVVQAAAEFAQLLDVAQYWNCVRIEQTPRDSPERTKLIFHAMESQRELIQLFLLTRLLMSQPNSDHLQKALIDWVAAQTPRMQELSLQVQSTEVKVRGGKRIDIENVKSKLEEAKSVEPYLMAALEKGADFNMDRVFALL